MASSDDESVSGRWLSDNSFPIPASLVKEQWRLIFTTDANERDLELAIAHCRDLVLQSDECSEERRWLVRHLVDLRYTLSVLQDAQNDACETPSTIKTVVGHHFVLQEKQRGLPLTLRQHCDYCGGYIWSYVHISYLCADCKYIAHEKCVDKVVRVCAHVIVSENGYPIPTICPSIGLSAQRYRCAECKESFNGSKSWMEPRLCEYNGLYYCNVCHWNDSSIIPARVICNWDHAERRVCRASLQQINLFLNKPLIKLEEINPKLFVFLEKLGTVKKLRNHLIFMRKYLIECREAQQTKLMEVYIKSNERHLILSSEMYSLQDLLDLEAGDLQERLQRAFNAFNEHIRQCEMCLARAYICEICSNVEVIFPFDDGCILCEKCNSIYHRVCLTRKNNNCPKCLRLQERKKQSGITKSTENINTVSDYNDNDADEDEDESKSDNLESLS